MRHQFPDVRGEHNLHRASFNFIFNTHFDWPHRLLQDIHTMMGEMGKRTSSSHFFSFKTCFFFFSGFSAADPFGCLGFGANIWKAISNFIRLQKDVKLSLSPLQSRSWKGGQVGMLSFHWNEAQGVLFVLSVSSVFICFYQFDLLLSFFISEVLITESYEIIA